MPACAVSVWVGFVPEGSPAGDEGHHCVEVEKGPGTASHGGGIGREKTLRDPTMYRESRHDADLTWTVGDGCPLGSCDTGGMSGAGWGPVMPRIRDKIPQHADNLAKITVREMREKQRRYW